jgi:serine/threonine protein kinase/tetratricopeptide (TPR) repeat protein
LSDTPKPDPIASSADDRGLWPTKDSSPEGLSAGESESSLVDTTLGPFEVHDVIGTGAMGVVLSGIHPKHRVPVAIKAITDSAASDRRFREQLRDEVQAAAALNHPSIVTVLDYGETDEATEELTDGRVPAGTPYFVMERTRKGTLEDYIGRVSWLQAQSILLDVLDAIAHAHSTDLIHRDIKPANILMAQWGGRLIPKLGDFGIAFAIDGGSTMSSSVGTPRYMAPEQIEQPWRTHGPWSDLYAVGCVAYELLSGDKLFDASDLDEIYQQHFRSTHPRIEPEVGVPTGFQKWLDWMTSREPADRFQTAAEAACALADLPTPLREIEPDEPIASDVARLTPVLDPLLPDEQDADGGEDSSPEVRRLPDEWPQPTLKPLPIQMVGAGLGLFGVRSIPLVGRSGELDRMWRTFKQVDAADRGRVMVVRGTQGCGKTRLVEWFARRLKEFGAATVMRATHSVEGSETDGLSGMLARHFRTLRATDSEARQLVHDRMGESAGESPYELETMMQILRPATPQRGDQSVSIASPAQRYAVISRYLDHLADQRPVVIWADDIQWGSDTIEFARYVRENRQELGPVFVVLVGTDEVLAERDNAREVLGELVEGEAADELAVEPLGSVAHERLVEELLMLEGDLAREVVRRTSGNPLFAVELIGDWVQRAVLEVGDRGFELREGVEPTIPDHLHGVWVQRLEVLLEEYGDDAREALELAAALGQEVRTEEWRAVCDLAGIYLDDSLAAELTERRFANRTENGWSFAHAILHESIERLAREEGRWVQHRRYCANMVEVYYEVSTPRIAERFGRYAMSAHEFERALEPLMDGARGRRRRGEYRAAQQLLSDYFECLERMEMPDEDPRWGEGCVVRARTYLNDDEPREARRWAERALEAADTHHWDEIRPHAMGWLALAKQWLGESEAADSLQQAYRLLDSGSPSDRLRGVYGSVAHGLTTLREFDKADRLLEMDYQEAVDEEDERAVANNHFLRCRHAFFQQNFEDALDYAQTALNRFEQLGHLPGAATCQEFMAEIYRMTGDTDRAERLYRSCLELQDAIGFRKSIAQTNLATILLERGRASEAEKLFVLAADAFESSGRRTFRMVALAGLLACASSQGWWGALEEHLAPIRQFVDRTDECERDLAELLEFAADHLRDGGQYDRAREVYELALEQWRGLGADERVEEVEQKLGQWI